MKRKGLAVGIILLFLGVAIAPSINFNVVKASNDNDLIEVTTQACGIEGYENTTVKLTRQQYQNLEQYLVDFRARLNQTSTRDEAIPIFKEAVVELNKYGLLPKGMSVEQAQRLVTGPYQNTKLLKCLEKLSNEPCLISGEARGYTYFQGPVSRAIWVVLYILAEISLNFNMGPLFYLLSIIPATMSVVFSEFLRNLPYIGAIIYYGVSYSNPMTGETWYNPAEGNIRAIGSFGTRQWNGAFYGKLSSLALWGFLSVLYPGVNGFTGLKLYLNQTDFYFGFALNVNVGPSHP
jgi:hypothetical protein